MNKIKIILAFVSFLIVSHLYSQVTCGTPQIGMGQNTFSDFNYINNNPICINIQFHIVKETNGSGGATLAQLDQIVATLNNQFIPHNIFIKKLGFDIINNSSYFNMSDSGFNSLVAINNVPNAINFYLINSSSSWIGRAGAILSKNLVMMNSFATTGVAAHEVGHCLNLWHTFQGTASGTSGCPELINGSNCTTCGDYICDTPADANIGATGGYNPDLTNTMSYSPPASLNHFSILQGDRMRSAINNSSILTQIVSTQCSSIEGANSLCLNTNQSYTISNLNGATVTWSVTGSLQMITPINANTVSIQGTTNLPSSGTLTATISTGQIIVKIIQVGAPALPTGQYSNVIWVRKGMTIDFPFTAILGATTYSWTIVRDTVSLFPCGTLTQARFVNPNGTFSNSITTTLPSARISMGNCIGDYLVSCIANNTCGGTEVYFRYLTVGSSGSSPCNNNVVLSRYKVSENPLQKGVLKLRTGTQINDDDLIDIDNGNDSGILSGDGPCEGPYPAPTFKQAKTVAISIYDFNGKKVYSNEFSLINETEKVKTLKEEIVIDGLELKPNKYILVIDDGNKPEKQIIIIE